VLYLKKLTDILTDLVSSLIAKSEILHKNTEESYLFRCKYSSNSDWTMVNSLPWS